MSVISVWLAFLSNKVKTGERLLPRLVKQLPFFLLLLVSDSKNFENVLFSRKTKNKFLQADFTTESLPPGSYYWLVKTNH